MPVIDPIALLTEADEQMKSVRTSVKDFSFNELLSMYQDKELIINPDFQRLFRWTEEKESRLIESLILELPLPPIYVIELADGKYDLIDGLQRISSYMHFRGVLHAPHRNIGPGDFLTLYECDIIRKLNDLNYESLPEAFKIKLKRASIKMEIIRKESDARLRYHMFKRLNSGGIGLEQQEIRNCTIRLLGNTQNQFMIDCSRSAEFKNCVSALSDTEFEKALDQELVLRFFAMKNWRDSYVHDIGPFLTEYLESISYTPPRLPFDMDHERGVFNKTFQILNATLGDESFSMVIKRSNGKKSMYPFSVLHYEAFTLGVQAHLHLLDPMNALQMDRVKKESLGIKNDEEFIRLTTGGGKNTKGSLTKRVQFVTEGIGKAI